MTSLKNSANQTTTPSYSSDQLDIFMLFDILWRRKFIIIVSTLIGLFFAIVYTSLAKETWSSLAKVSRPVAADLAAYIEKTRIAYDIINKKDLMSKQYSVQKTADDLFDDFLKVASLSPTLTVTQSSGSNTDVGYAIFASTAASADRAQNMLVEGINILNELAVREVTENFNAQVRAELVALKNQLELVIVIADAEKKKQLTALTRSLDIAKKATITEMIAAPISLSSDMDSIYFNSFLLGEKLLLLQIEALRDAPTALPNEYDDLQYKINILEGLLESPGPTQAFSYMEGPSPPTLSTPKLSLLSLIGALFGAMVGASFVLVQSAYRNRPK